MAITRQYGQIGAIKPGRVNRASGARISLSVQTHTTAQLHCASALGKG